MNTIGLAGIQKNISILTNLSEPLRVVDKRRREDVAIIYPIKKQLDKKKGIISLAGKYASRIPKDLKSKNLDELIDRTIEKSLTK